jgi:hypothetical protein
LVRAVGRGRFQRGAQCNSKSQKCMYIVEYTFTAGVPTILSGLFCPFFLLLLLFDHPARGITFAISSYLLHLWRWFYAFPLEIRRS